MKGAPGNTEGLQEAKMIVDSQGTAIPLSTQPSENREDKISNLAQESIEITGEEYKRIAETPKTNYLGSKMVTRNTEIGVLVGLGLGATLIPIAGLAVGLPAMALLGATGAVTAAVWTSSGEG